MKDEGRRMKKGARSSSFLLRPSSFPVRPVNRRPVSPSTDFSNDYAENETQFRNVLQTSPLPCYFPVSMRNFLAIAAATGAVLTASIAPAASQAADRPFHTAELVFPLEHWHNHSSMVVELPDGDLFVCWFHGSGER